MGRTALALLLSLLALVAGPVLSQDYRLAVVVDPGGARESEGAQRYLARTRAALDAVGAQYDLLSEKQLLHGALDAYPVAVVPYAPNLSAAGRATLRTFCHDGGKVMCFYTTYGLEAELGLLGTTYVSGADPSLFAYVRCEGSALPGLPDGFAQSSWNIRAPDPAPQTRVLATWLDPEHRETDYAAATLSDGGFYFSHVLVAEGDEALRGAGRMLVAAADYMAARRGKRRQLAIVHGTASESDSGDGRLVGDMVGEMESILAEAGLPYTVVTDEAVARGSLRDRQVAIFPLNFRLAPGEAEAVERFVSEGGAIIGCFSLNGALARLAGVAGKEFRSGGSDTPFQVVAFDDAAPDGVPSSFGQHSANTMAPRPAEDGRIIATWRDNEGRDTGVPAAILSPTGMYFSYILHAGDVGKTSQFMLAVIAHLADYDVYGPALAALRERLWDFRRFDGREALLSACRDDARAHAAAQQATELAEKAAAQQSAGNARGAYLTLREARAAAETAFIGSLPSTHGPEFRGAWQHDVSVPGQDWDAHFRSMAERHLNAYLPNVCAAGYAHYESDLLPTSDFVREHGPQIGPMLEAAKRHGIEAHLWRVNYNLWRPDREVIDRYAAQGRLCLDPRGDIVGLDRGNATLCPSHPANQQFEIDCMVEMTSKFHPDGIHFDYIRYPGPQACYCPGCRSRFEAGLDKQVANWPDDVLNVGPLRQDYLQFRRDQITAVVRETRRRSREVDPDVLISAAVFSSWDSPWGARDGVGQDWPLWAREGYLDFVCPMNYTQSAGELAALVRRQRELLDGRIPLQSGIGAYRSGSSWRMADLVDTARSAGADGLCFFDYRGRVVGEYLPALVAGPLRRPAATPWTR